MDREEAHEALESVAEAMAEQHTKPDRLEQLASHLATVHMVVDHLFDHTENEAAEGAQG